MSIHWQSINPRMFKVPGISKTTRPISPTFAPGAVGLKQTTGSAVAYAVSALSQITNSFSIRYRIKEELERLALIAEARIPVGSKYGILAVIVLYEARSPAGPSYSGFVSAFTAGIAPNFEIAYDNYVNRPSIEAGHPNNSTRIKLFFWGTRE